MSFEVCQNSSPEKKATGPSTSFITISIGHKILLSDLRRRCVSVSSHVFIHQVQFKFRILSSLSRIRRTPTILLSPSPGSMRPHLHGEAENASCTVNVLPPRVNDTHSPALRFRSLWLPALLVSVVCGDKILRSKVVCRRHLSPRGLLLQTGRMYYNGKCVTRW